MAWHPKAFLGAKIRGLFARARRLARLDHHTIGIRFEDLPHTPSRAHFAAANRRLAEIDADIHERLQALAEELRGSVGEDHVALLSHMALVEREVDRARRAFGLFFEVFSQRGTRFAEALHACDNIAMDCFRVVRSAAPGLFRRPLLKPVTYLEHGISPATFRRGVMMRRLLGEHNPFPLVRVPYERLESPWGMGVLLHEIGHNLHADLGIWHETEAAVQRRVLSVTHDPWLTRIWGRWHKEIFADLIALLLGGPAIARSMLDFLAYPPPRAATFRPLGVHPTPYLRAFLLAEMLRRMGFAADAHGARSLWQGLYGAGDTNRLPPRLLASAARVTPHVVDELAFQTRRGLGHRALVDVIPFRADDEAAIRQAAPALLQGEVPRGLPPRFVVSASRYAFERGPRSAQELARVVLRHLARNGPALAVVARPPAAQAA